MLDSLLPSHSPSDVERVDKKVHVILFGATRRCRSRAKSHATAYLKGVDRHQALDRDLTVASRNVWGFWTVPVQLHTGKAGKFG